MPPSQLNKNPAQPPSAFPGESAPAAAPPDQVVAEGEERFGDSMAPELRNLLLPLLLEVAASPYLIADSIGLWRLGNDRFWMPRFIFQRTPEKKSRIKVGLFAGIHGDEPEGVLGLVELVRRLNAHPEVARDYRLFIYPLCNPSGLVDGTRRSRSGHDCNRLFWQNSSAPEVQLLEKELRREKFDGLIALHADGKSDGVYGFVRGRGETSTLLQDALNAARHALPLSQSSLIDGFAVSNAIIRTCHPGVLSAPSDQQPPPWEIILKTPQGSPAPLQRQAFILAIAMILGRNRTLQFEKTMGENADEAHPAA